ncbi:MAG TPA: GTP 3',8-cyclase MoaA [Thermoanaerobaculia bacterium]|nr:GTP 3',8-cyclase MoaA [Thermoanaerobaculia bacterium]
MRSIDALGRPLRDLRVSVTDRCNFRCVYCMPREVFGRDFAFVEREELLTFEEIARMCRIAVGEGVEKIRLTGGEPLLRRRLERLVGMLSPIDGLTDLALTTNGALLTKDLARALRDAGLRRITISADAVDGKTFRAISDTHVPVARVLEAIEIARDAGFSPVKVDAVIMRGVNEGAVADLARRYRGTGIIVRFIEYMDVGNSNGWRMEDVVTGSQILEMIAAEWPVEPAAANYAGEVARRWRYSDGAGEIGIITSVTQPFCGDCTRLRLTASGELYTCLFAGHGHDVRGLLRGGADDASLAERLRSIWTARSDRYSELRSAATPAVRKVEMSHIGG